MAAVDTYHVIAKYYDGAYAAKQDLVDLPFYLDLAEQSGGPVLEVACGTGRVLIPIARKGVEICGVDNSQPMLQALTENLARASPPAPQQTTPHQPTLPPLPAHTKFPL